MCEQIIPKAVKKKKRKVNYYECINSQKWADKKAEFKSSRRYRKGKCFVCCNWNIQLHIHHINYERLGKEKMADLRVLCFACHAATHARDDGSGKFRCNGMRWEWYQHANRNGLWRLRFGRNMEYAAHVAQFFKVEDSKMVYPVLNDYFNR